MKRTMAGSLLSAWIIWTMPDGAQGGQEIKLVCDGKYSSWKSPKAEDVPVGGTYVKIGDTSVEVEGSPGFDATYSITRRDERSISWKYDPNPEYYGVVNRLNGELTMGQMKHDSDQMVQLFNASCGRAEPIF